MAEFLSSKPLPLSQFCLQSPFSTSIPPLKRETVARGHWFTRSAARLEADRSRKFFIPTMTGMRPLDPQERLIVRQLIRDPRESDNGIGEATGVNVRTVGRKRQRMEQ